MKIFIFILIALLFSDVSYAQNCKKLDKWTQSVESEFTDIDFTGLTIGGEMHNRIKYNLLSDKYFVPVFKRSFDEIGNRKRNQIRSVINQCTPSLNVGGGNNPFFKPRERVKRLKFYVGRILRQENAYEQAVRKVQELRSMRNMYDQTIAAIKNEKLTYPELNGYKNLLTTKYSILLPSELNFLSELIQQRESEVANKTLLAKANSFLELKNSLLTLEKLQSFKSDYQFLFDQADSHIKQQAEQIIEEKTDEVLSSLIQIEKEKVENIALNEDGIDRINDLFRSLNDSYGSYRDHELTQELFAKIKNRKTQIINSVSDKINSKVENTLNINDLNDIEATYLSLVLTDDPTVVLISNQIADKIQEIRNNRRQKELARKEEQRRRQEEIGRNNLKKIQQGYTEGEFSRSDFWFPYAIELLAKGDISNFPDPLESRRWLFHFYSILISGNPPGLPDKVDDINFVIRLTGYAGDMIYNNRNFRERTNAKSIEELFISQEGKFGALDAKMLIANNNRQDLKPIIRSAISIIERYSEKNINPHAKYRFLSYGSQKLLDELGIRKEEVERFRPGYKDNWDLLKDKMVYEIQSDTEPNSSKPKYSELYGTWLDTMQMASGETVPLNIYFQSHKIYNESSGIYFNGESYYMPAVIFRGNNFVETSMEMKNTNFKILFVGQLSDNGKKLTGILHHFELGDREYQLTFHKKNDTD